jgi:hypothetical protein
MQLYTIAEGNLLGGDGVTSKDATTGLSIRCSHLLNDSSLVSSFDVGEVDIASDVDVCVCNRDREVSYDQTGGDASNPLGSWYAFDLSTIFVLSLLLTES